MLIKIGNNGIAARSEIFYFCLAILCSAVQFSGRLADCPATVNAIRNCDLISNKL